MSSKPAADTFLQKEEPVLNTLTKEYADLRETVDKRLAANKIRLYPARVAACIAVFVGSFLVSLDIILPMLSYVKSSDVATTSVIIGISAGIIMAIIFVVFDNLNTQRLNEKLAAKSYQIKIQRTKILSYLQEKNLQL